jgi:rhomboid family protein
MIPLRDDNPSSSFPIITILLILICVAVFVYMDRGVPAGGLRAFVLTYGAIPAKLTGRAGPVPSEEYGTLVTAQFLHGSWLHLIGNMLFLWIFGDNVEDLMGHGRFLVFYLLVGAAAVLAHAVVQPASTVPLVGASGAIAGVLGAYLILFPRARIISLVTFGFFLRTVAVPAVLFLPLWFAMQFVYGVASLGSQAEAVAWWAHVGGFVAGVALVLPFARRRPRERWS